MRPVVGAGRRPDLAWPPERGSGVILHPTSLPGGTLGPEAYAFVDWLERAGQRFWQVLALNPPDRAGSPYAAASAFAGSPSILADPGAPVSRAEIADFRDRQAYWIDGWLRHAGRPRRALADQVRFDREWLALRRYANDRGVRIVGDLPIYVAPQSDAVANRPDLFDRGRIAGVPPDAFSDTGQMWSSPTYRWGALRREGYRWWVERFRRTVELFDATRVDHFRGFVAYWAVPRNRRTARAGRWYRGPGHALFRAVESELGRLRLIAEDLGVITPAVDRLREAVGAIGMHVLEFGFDSESSGHHPDHHRELSAVYTGTHDNVPVAGWWRAAAPAQRELVERALERAGIEADDPAWALVELAQSSRARLAIVQLQDVLGLGAEARMNHPGTSRGNWSWRLVPGQLTAAHADRLRAACARQGRCPAR